MLQPAAIAEHHIRADDAIRPDVHVRADLRRGIDDGGGVNHEEMTNAE
jgi:hypothetical protein